MTQAVSYLRVSGEAQVDKGGFPRQRETIESCCASKGFQLVHEYRDEAVPGKLDETYRPAFNLMIGELLKNGCRTIVVENLGRLAREYRIQEHLLIYIASRKLTLYAADTGENITEAIMGDPMRAALVRIQGIFFQLEKDSLVEKLKKGRQYNRIQDGLAKGYSEEDAVKFGRCEGRKPYGEHPDHPEEKLVLDRIIALKSKGETPERIAQILNNDAVPSRMGKLWKAATIAKILRRNA